MPKRTTAAAAVAGAGLAGLVLAVPASAATPHRPVATAKTGTLRLLVTAKKGAKEKGGTYVVDKTENKKAVKVAGGTFLFGKASAVTLTSGTYSVVISTTKSKTTDKGVAVHAGKVHTLKATVA